MEEEEEEEVGKKMHTDRKAIFLCYETMIQKNFHYKEVVAPFQDVTVTMRKEKRNT